jgi:predicted unusual protein kinase regulating ubiquinone biosynthesis (AarF/ABC1/UbiB family)
MVNIHFYFVFKMVAIFCWEAFLYAISAQSFQTACQNTTQKWAQENILCVKVFQACACQKWKINYIFSAYCNHVPYDLQRDINMSLLQNFCEVMNLTLDSHIPMHSGMISLVFKAREKTMGIFYIIKIRRNGIETQIVKAMEEILFVCYFLSFFPFFKHFKLKEIVQENATSIQEQCNFEKEIYNMNLMREKCKYLNYVIIPEAIGIATAQYPNIILMTFIEGMTLDELQPDAYHDFAKLVFKFGFSCMLNFGVTHGDLHSGNVLFIEKKDTQEKLLGLLDFGILQHFSSTIQQKMSLLILDFFELKKITNNTQRIQNIQNISIKIMQLVLKQQTLQLLSLKEKDEIIDIILAVLVPFLENNKNINQYDLLEALQKINTSLHKISIEYNPDILKTQVALAMIHNLIVKICHEDYKKIGEDVLNEMFKPLEYLHEEW